MLDTIENGDIDLEVIVYGLNAWLEATQQEEAVAMELLDQVFGDNGGE